MVKKKKKVKISPDEPKGTSISQGRTQQCAINSDLETEADKNRSTASFCSPWTPISQECTFSARAKILFLILESIEDKYKQEKSRG